MTPGERRLLVAIAHAVRFLMDRTAGGDNRLMQREKEMETRLLREAIDDIAK